MWITERFVVNKVQGRWGGCQGQNGMPLESWNGGFTACCQGQKGMPLESWNGGMAVLPCQISEDGGAQFGHSLNISCTQPKPTSKRIKKMTCFHRRPRCIVVNFIIILSSILNHLQERRLWINMPIWT